MLFHPFSNEGQAVQKPLKFLQVQVKNPPLNKDHEDHPEYSSLSSICVTLTSYGVENTNAVWLVVSLVSFSTITVRGI
ncbi:hypothetical protein SAMN05661012_05142 [Chitinophaga sancti]|uniref:Uncharacterized protein n=1 Tax=Chitinophaga sancti TaxID=1004 RepID=A0A1K1SCF5_9BACT|nr:hypothetical protein SAMN05661012_05142 [Chitinophaga sancti]